MSGGNLGLDGPERQVQPWSELTSVQLDGPDLRPFVLVSPSIAPVENCSVGVEEEWWEP